MVISKSQKYIGNVSAPQVTSNMAKAVSQYRRGTLEDEVQMGLFRDGSSSPIVTGPSVISESKQLFKHAQVVHGGYGGYQTGTAGNVMLQAPEIYSPLWLNSNLSMPRDRATINAWCRAFFALNAFVHNSISLHSTYPISKLNIKCPNKEVERFFNEMIEEIDLMNVCVQIAQEYWLLGEAFPYAEYDSNNGKWSRIFLQNPDFMVLNNTVVSGEPSVQMKPDEHLKQIVHSNRPQDIAQRKMLSPYIIEAIKRGGNIPLESFNVSHLARKISPYSVHGTGLPVCVFRQLMLFDQLRECHDDQTEVLTKNGFKKIYDLLEVSNSLNPNSNYVNGIQTDKAGEVTGVLKLKENVEVACFNFDTEELEYHIPNELHMSQYNGEMIHFNGKKTDILVSPNHKMLVQKKNRKKGVNGWSEWRKTKACELSDTKTYRFRNVTNWNGNNVDNVHVLDKDINIDLYLKFLGYIISEGCLSQNCIDICQKVTSDCITDIKDVVSNFSKIFNINLYERNVQTKDYKKYGLKKQPDDRWNCRLNNKSLTEYFIKEISVDNKNHTAQYKKVPQWVKNLSTDKLKLFLNTLLLGDGSHLYNKKSISYKYYTASEHLANDVQEIAFKCGYSPTLYYRQRKNNLKEYVVSWSESNFGKFPILTKNNKYPSKINKTNYNGVVWCFEVPTGFFVTRRNGKISIQGNSKYVQASSMINPLTLVKIGGSGSDGFKPTHQHLEQWRNIFAQASYDKDFKIFTHDGVDVQKIGASQGIYDISNDIIQLIKEIFIGLQVPSVLMDGGADTTYANGSVALDVLRQRYMQFRNMLSAWLKRKIFAPISKIQGFYEYRDGSKHLIVPEIDWNYMSIFDAQDHISNLITLSSGEGEAKKVSEHTLYRSLGLDYDDEHRKMRKEAITSTIHKKEAESLNAMTLNELRTLSEDDEIPEVESNDSDNGSNKRNDNAPNEGMPELDMPDADIPGLNLGNDMGTDIGVPDASFSEPAPEV